jgi:hypothetical protein
MNRSYLNRVLTYLQQELPESYRDGVMLLGEKLIIAIPDTVNFQQTYEVLHVHIIDSINRIRNRDIDLEFTVKSPVQERDFKILK